MSVSSTVHQRFYSVQNKARSCSCCCSCLSKFTEVAEAGEVHCVLHRRYNQNIDSCQIRFCWVFFGFFQRGVVALPMGGHCVTCTLGCRAQCSQNMTQQRLAQTRFISSAKYLCPIGPYKARSESQNHSVVRGLPSPRACDPPVGFSQLTSRICNSWLLKQCNQ